MKQKHTSPHLGKPVRRAHLLCDQDLDQPAKADAGDLPEILAAIRLHEVRTAALETQERAKSRAASEIGTYLGTEATAKILQRVSLDCRNLLSELQPTLSLFLGRRAAGRLTSRVAEELIVRF